MSNKEIITEIIEDLETTVGLNWSEQKNCKINREKLIECWSEYRAGTDGNFYGYRDLKSLTYMYKKIFKKLNKTNSMQWKNYILLVYNYKYCSSCRKLKNINNYYNKRKYCISCQRNKDKIYSKTEQAKTLHRNTEANRRAAKLQRTPEWSDIQKIKEIYIKCPEGYHVDHIIPLQGELISGLHVENNLQYLTAHDNLVKGNRYKIG